jgi:hypothetical protein
LPARPQHIEQANLWQISFLATKTMDLEVDAVEKLETGKWTPEGSFEEGRAEKPACELSARVRVGKPPTAENRPNLWPEPSLGHNRILLDSLV